jgi:cbb3-type cytochrome oxidase subunit 1
MKATEPPNPQPDNPGPRVATSTITPSTTSFSIMNVWGGGANPTGASSTTPTLGTNHFSVTQQQTNPQPAEPIYSLTLQLFDFQDFDALYMWFDRHAPTLKYLEIINT